MAEETLSLSDALSRYPSSSEMTTSRISCLMWYLMFLDVTDYKAQLVGVDETVNFRCYVAKRHQILDDLEILPICENAFFRSRMFRRV